MNQQETNEIVSLLVTAYPQYFRKMSEEQAINYVSLFEESFKNDDFGSVKDAVVNLIGKRKYCPSVHEIREEMPKSEKEESCEMPADYGLPFYQHNALVQILGDKCDSDMLEWYKKHYWESMHPATACHGRYAKGASQ